VQLGGMSRSELIPILENAAANADFEQAAKELLKKIIWKKFIVYAEERDALIVVCADCGRFTEFRNTIGGKGKAGLSHTYCIDCAKKPFASMGRGLPQDILSMLDGELRKRQEIDAALSSNAGIVGRDDWANALAAITATDDDVYLVMVSDQPQDERPDAVSAYIEQLHSHLAERAGDRRLNIVTPLLTEDQMHYLLSISDGVVTDDPEFAHFAAGLYDVRSLVIRPAGDGHPFLVEGSFPVSEESAQAAADEPAQWLDRFRLAYDETRRARALRAAAGMSFLSRAYDDLRLVTEELEDSEATAFAEKDLSGFIKSYLTELGFEAGLIERLLPKIVFVDSRKGESIAGQIDLKEPRFRLKLTNALDNVYLLVDRSVIEKSQDKEAVIGDDIKINEIIHEIVGHQLVRATYPEFVELYSKALSSGREPEGLMIMKVKEELLARFMTRAAKARMLSSGSPFAPRTFAGFPLGPDGAAPDIEACFNEIVESIRDESDGLPTIQRYRQYLLEHDTADLMDDLRTKAAEMFNRYFQASYLNETDSGSSSAAPGYIPDAALGMSEDEISLRTMEERAISRINDILNAFKEKIANPASAKRGALERLVSGLSAEGLESISSTEIVDVLADLVETLNVVVGAIPDNDFTLSVLERVVPDAVAQAFQKAVKAMMEKVFLAYAKEHNVLIGVCSKCGRFVRFINSAGVTNSVGLSHGYCYGCLSQAHADLGVKIKDEAEYRLNRKAELAKRDAIRKMLSSEESKVRARARKPAAIAEPSVITPEYIKTAAEEMSKALLNESYVMVKPCTIGMVVKATIDEDVDEKLARDMEVIGRHIAQKIEIRRGVSQYKVGNITYITCVDDGTGSPDNVGRMEVFKNQLSDAGNPKDRTFAWVVSNDLQGDDKQARANSIGDLSEVANLVGLRGDYLPVSWQMLVGPHFANLIDSKNREPGKTSQDRIDGIVDAIIRSISQMTRTDMSKWDSLRQELRTLGKDDLAKKFNGAFFINLPPIIPVSGAIEQCRHADLQVQTAL